jgi:hypothetical protein
MRAKARLPVLDTSYCTSVRNEYRPIDSMFDGDSRAAAAAAEKSVMVGGCYVRLVLELA